MKFDIFRPISKAHLRQIAQDLGEGEFPVHCERCGYELTGLSNSRCPECGTGFDRRQLVVDQHLDSDMKVAMLLQDSECIRLFELGLTFERLASLKLLLALVAVVGIFAIKRFYWRWPGEVIFLKVSLGLVCAAMPLNLLFRLIRTVLVMLGRRRLRNIVEEKSRSVEGGGDSER